MLKEKTSNTRLTISILMASVFSAYWQIIGINFSWKYAVSIHVLEWYNLWLNRWLWAENSLITIPWHQKKLPVIAWQNTPQSLSEMAGEKCVHVQVHWTGCSLQLPSISMVPYENAMMQHSGYYQRTAALSVQLNSTHIYLPFWWSTNMPSLYRHTPGELHFHKHGQALGSWK